MKQIKLYTLLSILIVACSIPQGHAMGVDDFLGGWDKGKPSAAAAATSAATAAVQEFVPDEEEEEGEGERGGTLTTPVAKLPEVFSCDQDSVITRLKQLYPETQHATESYLQARRAYDRPHKEEAIKIIYASPEKICEAIKILAETPRNWEYDADAESHLDTFENHTNPLVFTLLRNLSPNVPIDDRHPLSKEYSAIHPAYLPTTNWDGDMILRTRENIKIPITIASFPKKESFPENIIPYYAWTKICVEQPQSIPILVHQCFVDKQTNCSNLAKQLCTILTQMAELGLDLLIWPMPGMENENHVVANLNLQKNIQAIEANIPVLSLSGITILIIPPNETGKKSLASRVKQLNKKFAHRTPKCLRHSETSCIGPFNLNTLERFFSEN